MPEAPSSTIRYKAQPRMDSIIAPALSVTTVSHIFHQNYKTTVKDVDRDGGGGCAVWTAGVAARAGVTQPVDDQRAHRLLPLQLVLEERHSTAVLVREVPAAGWLWLSQGSGPNCNIITVRSY